jgi:hypothetical protein
MAPSMPPGKDRSTADGRQRALAEADWHHWSAPVPFAARAGLPPSSTLTVPALLCLMDRNCLVSYARDHLSIIVLRMEIRRGIVSVPCLGAE